MVFKPPRHLKSQDRCRATVLCLGALVFRSKSKEPINRTKKITGYRLCVYASGSVITVVLNCFTLIIISCLHFGQYSGKFSSTVLSQILILVLLLQLGHNSHSVFFILCFSSDSRISMDNYIYNSRSFHRLVETITHAPTMSTVKTMEERSTPFSATSYTS